VDINSALEYVLSQETNFDIAAVNLSIGALNPNTTPPSLYTDQATCDADWSDTRDWIAQLRAAKTATAAAAGNSFQAFQTDGLTAPACLSNAVSVGATTKSDVVARYSNTASFLSLLAPGGDDSTPQPDGTLTYSASCSEGLGDICSSVPVGSPAQFAYSPGTSMATPHVAGAFAVLRQQSTTASVSDLLSVLQSNGVPIDDNRVVPKITKPRIRLDNTPWVARYPANGFAVGVSVDISGNSYVAGWTRDPISTADSYAVVKYDADGKQLWAKTYNGGLSSELAASAIDGSGNVYLTGRVCVLPLDPRGGCDRVAADTVKLDSNGNQLWTARLDNGAGSDYRGVSIAVDGSGNVYVLSLHSSGTDFSGVAAYTTVKYGSNGSQLWASTYTNVGSDSPHAIAISADLAGNVNVYVTGGSCNNRACDGGPVAATVKYDSIGNQTWVVRDANFWDVRAVAVDTSGNVFITGGSDTNTSVAKYDPTGTPVWAAPWPDNPNPAQGNLGIALVPDTSGNIHLTGSYSYIANGSGKSKALTLKYDATGSLLWAAYDDINGQTGARGTAIAVDSAGNIYVAGAQERNTVALKYDINGNQLWRAFQAETPLPCPALAVQSGDVYLATCASGFDFLTAKYTPR
jgi:subtilisin family serine protease